MTPGLFWDTKICVSLDKTHHPESVGDGLGKLIKSYLC